MDANRKRRPAVTYGKSSARKRPLDDAFSSLSFEDREDDDSFGASPFVVFDREVVKSIGGEGQSGKMVHEVGSRQQTSANNSKLRITGHSRLARQTIGEKRAEKASSERQIFDVPSSGDEEPSLKPRATRSLPRPRLIKTATDTSKRSGGVLFESIKVAAGKRLFVPTTQGEQNQAKENQLHEETSQILGKQALKTRYTAPIFTASKFDSAPARSMKQTDRASRSCGSQANLEMYKPAQDLADRAEFLPSPSAGTKMARTVGSRHSSHKIARKPISRENSGDSKARSAGARGKRLIAESVIIVSKGKSSIQTATPTAKPALHDATASPHFEALDPQACWFAETNEHDAALTVDESIWDTILDDKPPQKKRSTTRRQYDGMAQESREKPLLLDKATLIHGLRDESMEGEESSEDEMDIEDGDDQVSSQEHYTTGSQDSLPHSHECTVSPQHFSLATEAASDTTGFIRRAGPSVTYARQRSFLTEEVKEGGDPFADPLLLPARQFAAGFQPKPVKEDLEEEEQENAGMMKSLHELREAGLNKRFLDTIEGLFEDIEGDVVLGRKRAGYLELAMKLRDKAFFQKFRTNNFDRRLIANLEKENDEIIHFVLSFIVWSLLNEDPAVQLVRDNGIIPMLIRMLDFERSIRAISKDRKTNMSKAAQSLLADFCAVVERSNLFTTRNPKCLSPRIMALEVLDSIMRKLRQSGWMEECLPSDCLRKLIGILNLFTDSLADLAKFSSLDLLLLELPVSILESYSIGRDISPEADFSSSDIKALAKLFEVSMNFNCSEIKPIQLLILRLGINLTNGRPNVCELYADSTIMASLIIATQAKFEALSGVLEEEERLLELDMLVLSLALMINFAELSADARSQFSRKSASEQTPLTILLKLFLGRLEKAAQADSMEESQSNVGFGYLSILLGNLCQSPNLRKTIRSHMPNGSLQALIDAVYEFVTHNRKVDEERRAIMNLDEDEESEIYHRRFTERLERVAIDLRGYGS